MMTDPILSQVKQTIVETLMIQAPPDSIGDEVDLNAALGIDSVGFLQILTALEESFGVTFDDVHLSRHRLATPRKLAELVAGTRAAGKPHP